MNKASWRRVACASFLLLLTTGPAAWARVWTDLKGDTVEAEFVRVTGAMVVLQLPTGRVMQTPVAGLIDEDQAFIREALAADGVRMWTDQQGRQVHGKFVRIRDGKVYLKVGEKTTPVPFATLSTADRQFVREHAQQRGDVNELPEATPDESLPASREWTDADGVTATGQLDRVLRDGRVLLAVDGETRIVTITKLSADDHDYLRERLQNTELASLVPARPAPPVETVTATLPPPVAPPVVPPPVAPPPSPTPNPPATSYVPPPVPQWQPPPEPVVTMVLRCNRCGRPAPPGASYNDPCPYCNKQGSSPYEMGRKTGLIARYVVIGVVVISVLGWIARRLF